MIETIEGLRKDNDFMRAMARWKTDPQLGRAIRALRHVGPLAEKTNSLGLNSEQQAQRLGQIEGVSMVVDAFEKLFSEVTPPPKTIESTFGADERFSVFPVRKK